MSESAVDPMWKPEYKEGVVYLHVLPRSLAGGVVNISPFAIKLELWFRICDIPFQVVDYMGFGKKSQSPFILLNGEQIPDSNFIVEMVSKRFNKDAYPGTTAVDRAMARAFTKMLEENTAWTIFVYRYVEHTDEYAKYFHGSQLEGIKQGVEKRAYAHGIGRHAPEDIYRIGCDDIQAVSDFLGEKPYMLGDQPSLLDCVVFGILSQVVCVPIGFPQRTYIEDKCPNITRLFDKLRSKYWQNWDEQCQL